jgi:hypothetical protein
MESAIKKENRLLKTEVLKTMQGKNSAVSTLCDNLDLTEKI